MRQVVLLHGGLEWEEVGKVRVARALYTSFGHCKQAFTVCCSFLPNQVLLHLFGKPFSRVLPRLRMRYLSSRTASVPSRNSACDKMADLKQQFRLSNALFALFSVRPGRTFSATADTKRQPAKHRPLNGNVTRQPRSQSSCRCVRRRCAVVNPLVALLGVTASVQIDNNFLGNCMLLLLQHSAEPLPVTLVLDHSYLHVLFLSCTPSRTPELHMFLLLCSTAAPPVCSLFACVQANMVAGEQVSLQLCRLLGLQPHAVWCLACGERRLCATKSRVWCSPP